MLELGDPCSIVCTPAYVICHAEAACADAFCGARVGVGRMSVWGCIRHGLCLMFVHCVALCCLQGFYRAFIVYPNTVF